MHGCNVGVFLALKQETYRHVAKTIAKLDHTKLSPEETRSIRLVLIAKMPPKGFQHHHTFQQKSYFFTSVGTFW
jgi:hypothetical protein